jgi:hypothetical protein
MDQKPKQNIFKYFQTNIFKIQNLSFVAHNLVNFIHACMLKTICKLSLVGMQRPEKYKEKFDVSSEGPSSGVTRGMAFARKVVECLLIFFR